MLEPLYNHLKEENVNFLQFAFRWMNCLLMREISLPNIIRMWDTYLVCLTNIPFLFLILSSLIILILLLLY